jgi:predicted deacylase
MVERSLVMLFENYERWALAASLCTLVALVGCANNAQPKGSSLAQSTSRSCTDGMTTISGDFAGAGFASCEVLERGHFKLTITPEDSKVANCSAWYAFQANASQSQQVAIDLNYSSCGHRYRPKIRLPGSDWQTLPADNIGLNFTRGRTLENGKPAADATLRLALPAGKSHIAAQALILPEDNAAWLDQLSRSPTVTRDILGKSREGRVIEKIAIREVGVTPVRQVVLLGRQHPPETTGAIALQAFTERLLEDDKLSRLYRSRYSTIVVPLLNPDGVVNGHWRHNMGQMDLNRDWGAFSQPETRLMRDLLTSISKDSTQRLRLFLDFHSTHYDTIYTLTDNQVTDPAGFTAKWIAAYQALIPEKKLRIEPGYNPNLPTSKTWVYDTFKVPTATYEIGDETDHALIRRQARAAAEAMMSTLLTNDD